jgi:DNA-binding response OmpR family regulator
MREGARILITGGLAAARAEMSSLLVRAGFEGTDVPPSIQADGHIDLVLVLGDDVVPACAAARGTPGLSHLPILAVVPRSPAGAAQAAMAAGADDVILAPATVGGLTVRVTAQLRAAVDREGLRDVLLCEEALVEVQRVLAAGSDLTVALREALFTTLRVLDYERASIVLVTEASDQGYVVAATDDPTLSKFVVSLDLYPELRPALDRGQVVLVDDAASHPLTADRAAMLREHQVHRLAVFPIEWNLQTARILARVWAWVMPRHRQRALAHLSAALGGELPCGGEG